MKVIYKYPLEVTDKQTISMPMDAKIISIQEQKGKPVVWVMTNGKKPMKDVVFHMVETGKPFLLRDILKYLRTIQLLSGNYVMHIFVEEDNLISTI